MPDFPIPEGYTEEDFDENGQPLFDTMDETMTIYDALSFL